MHKHRLARLVATLLLIFALLLLIIGIAAALALGIGGFGNGWGPGSRVWLALPPLLAVLPLAAVLAIFGGMLFVLVRIENNLHEARRHWQAALELADSVRRPTPAVEAKVAGSAAAGAAAAGTAAVPAPEAGTVVTGENAAEPKDQAAPAGEPAKPAAPPAALEAGTVVSGEKATSEPAKPAAPPAAGTPAAPAGEAAARLDPVEPDLEEPPAAPTTEPRLPGSEEAARIAAEMAALRGTTEPPPKEDAEPGPNT